jgi:dihydroneopterin aldolase
VTLPPDRIAVRGLRARGRHGVLPAERQDGQEFVIDVVLAVDTLAAARSDALADTVDYSTLVLELVRVVEGEPVDLIETLAERLAHACLASDAVAAVEVTVHKPHAPVSAEFDDIAVTIARTRG